jgi:hypothetical protein
VVWYQELDIAEKPRRVVPVAGLPVLEEDVAELAHIGSVPRLTERACGARRRSEEKMKRTKEKEGKHFTDRTNGENEPIIAFQQEVRKKGDPKIELIYIRDTASPKIYHMCREHRARDTTPQDNKADVGRRAGEVPGL